MKKLSVKLSKTLVIGAIVLSSVGAVGVVGAVNEVVAYADNSVHVPSAVTKFNIQIDGKQIKNPVAEFKHAKVKTGAKLDDKDYNEKVFVPVRFLADSLGHKVDWEVATKTVNIDNGALKIQVGGFKYVKADGTFTLTDEAVYISNGKTMVDISIVGNSLGYNVDWDKHGTLKIATNKAVPTVAQLSTSGLSATNEKIFKDFYTSAVVGDKGIVTVTTNTGEVIKVAPDLNVVNNNSNLSILVLSVMSGGKLDADPGAEVEHVFIRNSGAIFNVRLLENFENEKEIKNYGDFAANENGVVRLLDVPNGAYKITLLKPPTGYLMKQYLVSTFPDWNKSHNEEYGVDQNGNPYKVMETYTREGKRTVGSTDFHCVPE